MKNPTQALFRCILSDIRVELSDEFDQNFERKAFFSEVWARRESKLRDGNAPLMVDTGALRQSITSETTDTSIVFRSTLPYAGIHNEGGDIVVTKRMIRFFWRKYYEAQGGLTRKKNGQLSKSKRNIVLSNKAEFWKNMALMKAGQKIRIPRRQFLGMHPQVEATLRSIIEDNLNEYFDSELTFNIRQL